MKSDKILQQQTSDQSLAETVIARATQFEGRIFHVETLQVLLPDGREAGREVVRHHGGVGVAALTDDGNIVLIRQYRVAVGRILREIPAGKLEAREDPLACAKRELAEETGYAAADWQFLGKIYPTPGYVDEALHLYMARRLTRGEQHLDPGEFLTVEEIPFETAVRDAADGRMEDGKSCIALLRVKARLEAENALHG